MPALVRSFTQVHFLCYWFLVFSSPKGIQLLVFCSTSLPIKHSWVCYSTFRLISNNNSSRQLLVRRWFVISNHRWWQLATICWCCPHYGYMPLFIISCFHLRFCPSIVNSILCWHVKVHWGFISISSLAEDAIVYFVKSIDMSLKRTNLLLEVCWRCLGKWSSLMMRKAVPLYYVHTAICASLKLMLHYVWSGTFPCFVCHYLTCNFHYIFCL
jgi:hypothetical protein